jgi:hypothetical protein
MVVVKSDIQYSTSSDFVPFRKFSQLVVHVFIMQLKLCTWGYLFRRRLVLEQHGNKTPTSIRVSLEHNINNYLTKASFSQQSECTVINMPVDYSKWVSKEQAALD